MILLNLYSKILKDFGDSKELVSKFYECRFDNPKSAIEEGHKLFDCTSNDVLNLRKHNEIFYYNFLKNQLLSNLQAMKYYSEVKIDETRRLVSTSSNCISTIHILVRDEINLNVYFRSSDFDTAWSVDVEFLCSLPNELIKHLNIFMGAKCYEEVNLELINKLQNTPVKLNMLFGSLHRTNQ